MYCNLFKREINLGLQSIKIHQWSQRRISMEMSLCSRFNRCTLTSIKKRSWIKPTMRSSLQFHRITETWRTKVNLKLSMYKITIQSFKPRNSHLSKEQTVKKWIRFSKGFLQWNKNWSLKRTKKNSKKRSLKPNIRLFTQETHHYSHSLSEFSNRTWKKKSISLKKRKRS